MLPSFQFTNSATKPIDAVDPRCRQPNSGCCRQLGSATNHGEPLPSPFLIESGYYRIDSPVDQDEGKPAILDRKDWSGDGKPLEFALYEAQCCTVIAN